MPTARRMPTAAIFQLTTALLGSGILKDTSGKHFPLPGRRHVDPRPVITLGFKQLPNGEQLLGTKARVGVQSGKRGPQIVATIINLFVMAGLVPAIHALVAVKTWMPGTSPGMTNAVLAGAPTFSDKLPNEAREGLGHLVRKRHHAS
jgi:hypothetical protein